MDMMHSDGNGNGSECRFGSVGEIKQMNNKAGSYCGRRNIERWLQRRTKNGQKA